MKAWIALVAGFTQLASLATAQELDGSDLRRELRERDNRLNKLSIEDQLKLRAAEQKAAQDSEVKAALEKRNKAVEEFRAAVRASMIKADRSIEPILQRVAIPSKQPSKQATVPPR